MGIIGWVAPPRQGKTLGMAVKQNQERLRGRQIFANYRPRFPHVEVDSTWLMKHPPELRNCSLGMDEFHVLIDSRNSMSDRNRIITYLVLQCGKRRVSLHFTTQDFGQVDIRLRRFVDRWVIPQKVAPDLFVYDVWNRTLNRLMGKYVLRGQRFYHLFDTELAITDSDLLKRG